MCLCFGTTFRILSTLGKKRRVSWQVQPPPSSAPSPFPPAYFRLEVHVEDAVGFVHHQVVQGAKVEALCVLQVVHQSTRCGWGGGGGGGGNGAYQQRSKHATGVWISVNKTE